MLSYTELKPGACVVLDNQPYLVMESEFLRMQQRKPVMKTKLKNLITGRTADRSFQSSDEIKEAELEKIKSRFIYENKGECWFHETDNPKNRFSFKSEKVGKPAGFLKSELEITAIKFGDIIINVELPIKAEYKIVEAPPAIRGDTAQGGAKTVVLETGAKISAPLFINEGDIIKVNTQTGEYVERVKKTEKI